MVSVQMEAASIIINRWKVFYEDIRDLPDLELVPDLEPEDGLEKGGNGCENKVLDDGQEDQDLVGRGVFVPWDGGFSAEILVVGGRGVIARGITNRVEFTTTVTEVRKWMTNTEAGLWAVDAVTDALEANADAVTDAEAAKASNGKRHASLEEWRPGWRTAWRGRMERDLAIYTKRRERRERKKKTSSRSDASVTKRTMVLASRHRW